jgi:hypothetical protein
MPGHFAAVFGVLAGDGSRITVRFAESVAKLIDGTAAIVEQNSGKFLRAGVTTAPAITRVDRGDKASTCASGALSNQEVVAADVR